MLNKLKRGNKYTIVGNDGFLEFNLQITLIDFMYKQYAQYEAVPVITYKKKGGKKVYTQYLNYQYTFLKGWQNVKMTKDLDDMWQERLKYENIDFSNFDIVLTGKCGEVEPYREYESLIDHSSDLIEKYGRGTEEYIRGLKEVFTRLNYSLSNDMIDYYEHEADYFLNSLDLLI